MKVSLLTYTRDPEKIVAEAAKLCYSKSSIEDLEKKMENSDIASFIGILRKMGHESPFEHACFTFGIEDVSRSLLAQLTRHRIASYSVQSQRYVDMTDVSFVLPPELIEEADLYTDMLLQASENYTKLKKKLMEKYVSQNMPEKDAEKKAQEDARFILPEATTTKIIVTMNARSLFNFFALRCCNRAQWEIRTLADSMYLLVKDVAPNLFTNVGPSCITTGKCSEGAMTCGHPRKFDF